MKSNNTRGWKKVFGFTFVQFVKTKSFIVGTVILALITVLITAGLNVIPKLAGAGEDISGDGSDSTDICISKVYVADSTGALTDDDLAGLQQMGFPLPERTENITAAIDSLSGAESGQVLVTVTAEQSDGTVTGCSVTITPETASMESPSVSGE